MKKAPPIVLALILGPLLSSCGTTRAEGTRPQQWDQAANNDSSAKVEYPAVIEGMWRLGPEPCHLPINPDADGQLEISADSISGYEATYTPVRIDPIPGMTSTWIVISTERYLGSQVTEEVQTFSLVGTTLIVKGEGYEETYVKCIGGAAKAEYPEALRGHWMPKGMECPRPIDQDSEYLLSISADMLGQYENTSKPLRVENAPTQPTKWMILSTFSPGTGEYEGEEIVTFAINGDTLSIASGNAISSYIKCN